MTTSQETPDDAKKNIVECILDLALIEKQYQNYLSQYYFNSQPVISIVAGISIFQKKNFIHLNFNLADILLIGALTQSSLLLSGSSGSGKTLLAELAASYLFGKNGYARKNITPDMNEQDFMDIDFGAIKDGKRLKEAILADDLFEKPVLIIDEANRAPPIIQNRLIQILENSIDLKSKIIHAGIPLDNDYYYHWNLLTLNYGDEYAGTSIVDRALKDRIIIDISIDNFPPTLDDQISMIRKPMLKEKDEELIPMTEIILKIFQSLDFLQLSLEAEALILYLSFTSNCIKSPTKSKYGVLFSPQYCKEEDCPFARNPPLNEICPYTFAPSNRILRRLVHTAKGFSLLRHAKIIHNLKEKENEQTVTEYLSKLENFEVSLQDIISIAPIVLTSKISMNSEWVRNKFAGNRYLACKHFLHTIKEQLDKFMNDILEPLVKEKQGGELTESEIGIRKRALREDFHYEGLMKYVLQYLI